jgi:hypothetical protein
MKHLPLLALALLLSFSASSSFGNTREPAIPLDIKKIAGKTKIEVDAILGVPSKTSDSKHGVNCYYEQRNIEVVFIKGLADWITIEGLGSSKFSENSLKLVGLQPKPPTFSNAFTKRWNNHEGFREVSMFGGTHGIDYIYVKTKSP